MIINEALNCVTSRRIERRFLPSVRAASENVKNRKRIQDLSLEVSRAIENHSEERGGRDGNDGGLWGRCGWGEKVIEYFADRLRFSSAYNPREKIARRETWHFLTLF